MSNEIKKEERSEYVSIYVTPTLKKEFELAKDNQALKETILKQYLSNEKEWLNDELKQIDESTVKYSAKLIGIIDATITFTSLSRVMLKDMFDTATSALKKIQLAYGYSVQLDPYN